MLTLDLGAQSESRASGLTHTGSAHLRNGYSTHTAFICTYAHRHTRTRAHTPGDRWLSTLSRKAGGGGWAAAHLQDGDLPLQGVTLLLQEAPGTRGVQQPEPVPQDRVSAKPRTQPQPPTPPQAPSGPSLLSPPCPLLPSTALQPLPSLFLGRMCPLLAYPTASTRTGTVISPVPLPRACGTACLYSPPHHRPSPV